MQPTDRPSLTSSKPGSFAAESGAQLASDQAALADLLGLCRVGRPFGASLLEQLDRAQAFAASRAVSLALLGMVGIGALSLI